MSSMNQSNGKKNNSCGSSAVNTPAGTPVTSLASVSNGQTATQTSPPPNNAPKYGTLVPNRIFVGGISANTTEDELMQLFNNYGKVKAAKIIQDRAGVSKGYGFITFESEDDAKRLQRDAEDIVLKERKLNIAPAIKKQPFSRTFDGSSPPAVAAGNPAQFYFQHGTLPYFQSGVAYYPPPGQTAGDPNAQQPPMYQAPSVYPTQSGPPQTATYPPVIFPAQPMYMPQQYPMPMPYEYNYYANGAPQYMVGGQGGPQSQVPPLQRPGSPPRQPCYGQQLPYNPETMYYNVPMYGTMEGPAIYQDPMDMANGTITEDTHYATMDNSVQQDLDHSNQVNELNNPPEQIIQHQHEPPHQPHHLHHHHHHQPQPNHMVTSDPTRQTNTPVVSLLSLDQHQDKDYTSMQGGRRRKLVNPPLINNNNNNIALHNFNSYPNNAPFHHHNHHSHQNYYNAMPPNANNMYGYGQNHFNGPFSFPVPQNFNKFRAAQFNGQDKTWARKRKTEKRNTMDSGSLSSLRTDSNSSASVADDIRNEESKPIIVTSVDIPPPAPYSPLTTCTTTTTTTTNHGYLPKNINNNNQPPINRHYANRPVRVGGYHPRNTYSNSTTFSSNARNISKTNINNNRSVPINDNNFTRNSEPVVTSVLNTNNKPSVSQFTSQVHTSSTAPPQHFAPPMRRGRRSMRRSAQAINEIGAGDAPLPNSDVSDTCKKLDSLKL